MVRFDLQFDLMYVPRVAGGRGYRAEMFPLALQVFASNEARSREPVIVQYASASQLSDRRHVSLPLVLDATSERDVFAPLRDAGAYASFAAVGRLFQRGRMARSTRVVFNAYATTMTEDGNQVHCRVGSTYLTLGQLSDSATLNIVQRTGKTPLNKGSLRISNVRVSRNGTPLTIDEFKREALLPPQDMEDETLQQEKLDDLVKCHLLAFTDRKGNAFLPTPSEKFIGAFHCPKRALNTLDAPTFCYLADRSTRADEWGFYVNALQHALRRSAMLVDQAEKAGTELLANGANSESTNAFLAMMVRMITLLASLMPYLDDFTNCNSDEETYSERLIAICEDMKSARVCGADDCEGTGQEPYLEVCEMMSERFKTKATTAEDRVLLLIQRVLRLYVPCLSLCAVTNKKAMPAASLAASGGNVPAHTICLLIPYAQFEHWVAGSYSAEQLRSTRFYAARARELNTFIGQLPVLIVDGTARVKACPLPLSAYYAPSERAALSLALSALHDATLFAERVRSCTDGTRITTEIFSTEASLTAEHRSNAADISAFYKFCISIQTLATIELGSADFVFVVNDQHTYGVRFNDVVLLSNGISLVPYLQVTPVEAAMIDMQLSAEECIPPLTTPSAAPRCPDSLKSLRRPLAQKRHTLSLVPRQMTLAVRLCDVGDQEVRAIQRATSIESVMGVDVVEYRVLDGTGIAPPSDMVDITLYF